MLIGAHRSVGRLEGQRQGSAMLAEDASHVSVTSSRYSVSGEQQDACDEALTHFISEG